MTKIIENARREEWIALAKRVGYIHAADVIASGDMSQEWMFAELIIAFAAGVNRCRTLLHRGVGDSGKPPSRRRGLSGVGRS